MNNHDVGDQMEQRGERKWWIWNEVLHNDNSLLDQVFFLSSSGDFSSLCENAIWYTKERRIEAAAKMNTHTDKYTVWEKEWNEQSKKLESPIQMGGGERT